MWTVPAIIGLWPSAEHFAADIGLKYPSYARVMKMRGRIPHRYRDAIVIAASRRGYALTRENVEEAHAHVVRTMEMARAS